MTPTLPGLNMSSSAASTSKAPEKSLKTNEQEDSQPTLGVLEEDDEFEEFAVAGVCQRNRPSCYCSYICDGFSCLDWDDSQTDLAHLAGAPPGAAKSGGDKLWEDNWDDDDIEDEFSVQLRCVYLFSRQFRVYAHYFVAGMN